MSTQEHWSVRVSQAVRDVKIEVIGKDDVRNESHAIAVTALLKAYGDPPWGMVYIEPYLAKRAVRPDDVLICHPDLGVLVVEVKGHRIGDIERVAAGNLFVRQGGFTKDKNAFKQAENAMFDIKTAVERKTGQSRGLPLFEFAVALPMITEAEWADKGYADSLERDRLLLKDDLENTSVLRNRLQRLVRRGLEEMGKSTPITAAHIDVIRDVFGDSAVINPHRELREEVPDHTLGAYIEDCEATEKNLSREQQELSRLTMNGHPRVIRGVAGSGKTVVLANMAARYVTRAESQPSLLGTIQPPRVAVLCFNRTLVPFLREKIRDAMKALFPDTNHATPTVRVTHLNGLMWSLAEDEHFPIEYIRVRDMPEATDRARAYRDQIKAFRESQSEWCESMLFDAVFIDEGQDFEQEEYLLLMDLLRVHPTTNEKEICIFYDDAQNVYGRVRPTWSDFGIDVQGGRRSRVMRECFRNTRETIELAFNVLLGVQSPPSMRVATKTFTDVSYLKELNVVTEGADGMFRVSFAERRGNPPVVRSFSDRPSELAFLSDEITRLICLEHVRPRDILVVWDRKAEFGALANALQPRLAKGAIKGILQVHHESGDKDQYLLREGYLTIATTKSAKGYDAPIVFVAGVDQFSTDTPGRGSFYVGATRAKYLLYLTGISAPDTLLQEARLVQSALVGQSGTSS